MAEQNLNPTMLDQMGGVAIMVTRMLLDLGEAFIKESVEQLMANEDMMKVMACLAAMFLVARTVYVIFYRGDIGTINQATVIEGVKDSANEVVETVNAIDVKAKIQEAIENGMRLGSNKVVPSQN